LALIQIVATRTIKRVFITINIIKNWLCNRIEGQWIKWLFGYVYRNIFKIINNIKNKIKNHATTLKYEKLMTTKEIKK